MVGAQQYVPTLLAFTCVYASHCSECFISIKSFHPPDNLITPFTNEEIPAKNQFAQGHTANRTKNKKPQEPHARVGAPNADCLLG